MEVENAVASRYTGGCTTKECLATIEDWLWQARYLTSLQHTLNLLVAVEEDRDDVVKTLHNQVSKNLALSNRISILEKEKAALLAALRENSLDPITYLTRSGQ